MWKLNYICLRKWRIWNKMAAPLDSSRTLSGLGSSLHNCTPFCTKVSFYSLWIYFLKKVCLVQELRVPYDSWIYPHKKDLICIEDSPQRKAAMTLHILGLSTLCRSGDQVHHHWSPGVTASKRQSGRVQLYPRTPGVKLPVMLLGTESSWSLFTPTRPSYWCKSRPFI